MNIIFIQTGGSIDKDYPRKSGGYAFEFGEPACKRILENMDPSFTYDIMTAFTKDSLDISSADRQLLLELIKKQEGKKIIITHGTDTMIETASFLSNKIKDKLIIITGAMRPEHFKNSDASVNLGVAIGGMSILKKGVYISMHGVLKEYKEVKRNPITAKFE